ncbi:MAG TPA: hypothetical protein VER79_13260 [Candidatus Limnocylindrales bacterium]|nr:hypothetical protein [Candidatus Limnocylindrales bacterium]
MFNPKDFLASQADRDQQLHMAEQHNTAAHSESRVGPVFGPLMARVGQGMVAAGTLLQQRYAEHQRDAAAPALRSRPVTARE